jgi:chromosome segregation ATPase
MVEIEASLKARAEVELGLQRRAADSHIKLELTRQRLSNLAAQVSAGQRALQRENDRANSAEGRTAAGAEALAEVERRLADAISGRAKLHVRLEREHALRLIAEAALQTQQEREAKMEEQLQKLVEGIERALGTFLEQLAGRLNLLANLARSVEQLADGVKPCWSAADCEAPPRLQPQLLPSWPRRSTPPLLCERHWIQVGRRRVATAATQCETRRNPACSFLAATGRGRPC